MSAGPGSSPQVGGAPTASELRATRSRAQLGKRDRACYECCVCLESELTEADISYPFVCTHHVCDACNHSLQSRGNLKCPQCRQNRLGYTDAEVEQANQEQWPSGSNSAPPLSFLTLNNVLAQGEPLTSADSFVVLNFHTRAWDELDQEQDVLDGSLQALAVRLTQAFNRSDRVSPGEFRRTAEEIVRNFRHPHPSSR